MIRTLALFIALFCAGSASAQLYCPGSANAIGQASLPITSLPYTIGQGDICLLKIFNSQVSGKVFLPPANPGSSFPLYIQNIGSGTLTLQPIADSYGKTARINGFQTAPIPGGGNISLALGADGNWYSQVNTPGTVTASGINGPTPGAAIPIGTYSSTFNGLCVTPSATGQRATLQFCGVDATRGGQFWSQGTGTLFFGSGTNNNAIGSLQVLDCGGACANAISVRGGTSGQPGSISSPLGVQIATPNILTPTTITFSGAQTSTQYLTFGSGSSNGSYSGQASLMFDAVTDSSTASTANSLSLQNMILSENAGFTGNRSTRNCTININGTSGVVADDSKRQWQCDILTASASANQGGSSPHAGLSAGFLYVSGFQAQLKSGATNFSGLIAQENDCEIDSGASAAQRTCMQSISYGVGQGADFDGAYTAGRLYTAPGWLIGYALGSNNSPWPIDPAGAVQQWQAPNNPAGTGNVAINPIAALGTDYGGINFSSCAFRSAGNFCIDGSGFIHSGSVTISTSGATVTLDAPGSVLNTATLSNGGSGYVANDQVFDRATGTIITINTVTAGVVSTFTVTQKGAVSSGSFPATLTMQGGTGSGFVVSTTGTAATTMAINPTGSVVPGKLTTVSGLPACGSTNKGGRASVTDANGPTFLGTLTGGGSTVTPVFCNGSAWVAG